MKKKILALSMALVLAFTTLITASLSMLLTGTKSEAGSFSEVKVNIHYYRFDKNYTGWNLWVWPDGKEGKAYQFDKETSYGKLASFTLPNMTDVSKIGFIVRYSQPGGDEWKDREFGDRFITKFNDNGTADVWLVQGQETVYYSESEADFSPRVTRAALDTPTTLSFDLNQGFTPTGQDNEQFVLTSGADTIPIKTVEFVPDANGKVFKGIITSSQSLDLLKPYQLSKTGYKAADVRMGNIFSSPEFEREFTYKGDDLGLTYSAEQSKFRLWAPTATSVKLNIYDTHNQKVPTAYPMDKAEKGTWTKTLDGDLKGKFFTYSVLVNGIENEAVDPYAKAVSVNGEKGAIIDLGETHPEGWLEQEKPAFSTNATDAVIYELHVRDFSIHPESGMKNKGKFLAFTEENTTGPNGTKTGLAHMKDLGVTHVQLLPIYDYATVDETKLDTPQFNWGYDPKNWNAPEGSYSTDPYAPGVRINELKQAIQSMHKNGMRVIMDVVYNHVYNLDPSNVNKIVPGYYFRYKDDGKPANGTGVGNETASERSMMRKLIVDSTKYWAQEYKLDGYRFDLMGIHDVETMNQVRAEMTKIDPSFVIIGEGWIMGNSLDDNLKANQNNAPKMKGIAHFNDYIRDGLKGSVWSDGDVGFVNGNLFASKKVKGGIAGGIETPEMVMQFAKTPDQSVTYVEAHDNLTLWDKLEKTSSELSEKQRISMHKLASSIAMTAQGVAFIHAGQEFLRTKGGDHNSYKSPDSVNQMDWARKSKYSSEVEYMKGLIELRKQHPAFRMTVAEDVRKNLKFMPDQEGLIGYTLNGKAVGDEWEKIVVLHNANLKEKVISLPEAADWTVVVNGERAGVKPLETFSGSSVKVEPLSTKILYLGKAPDGGGGTDGNGDNGSDGGTDDGTGTNPDETDKEPVKEPTKQPTKKPTDNGSTNSGNSNDSNSEYQSSTNDDTTSSTTSSSTTSNSTDNASSESEQATGNETETTETATETTAESTDDNVTNDATENEQSPAAKNDQDKPKSGVDEEDKSNIATILMIAVTVVGLLVLGLFILIIRRSGKRKG